MDKGIRNILVILGVFCLVSLISAVRFFQIERATYQRYLKVKSENVKLDEEIFSLNQEKLNLVNKLEAISKELKEVRKEAEVLEEKYNSLMNEKKELSMQVETLTQEKENLEKRILEVESEDFLARLLKKKVMLEVKVKNLEEKLKKTKSLEREIEAITKAKLELQEQLAQEKEVSEYLSRDFLKEKQERLLALSRAERIEKEKDELKILLDRAKDDKSSLEKELIQLRGELKDSLEERERLAAQLANMEEALKERLAEVSMVRSKLERAMEKPAPEEEAVELPPIVVKAEPSPSVSPQSLSQEIASSQVIQGRELEGKIVTINEEHRFVIIDLGKEDGLELGMVFGVYHDNKEIAKIKVVETRRQIAAADIISLKTRTKIKPGDIVKGRIKE